jgi:2-phosphosulfolactate phosphatase
MRIEILQLIEGARAARGLTVVIDVFRAFSVACYVVGNGARRIIPVGDLEVARALKAQNPDWLLIGERGGQKLPGFDYGNSPTEVEHVDFSGRTVVQTTSAGTQGMANATEADEVLSGGFVNAPAIVSYIHSRAPRQVSLVCMGERAVRPSDEDTLCAQWLRAALCNEAPDFAAMQAHLRSSLAGQRFLDAKKASAPARDFDLCLDLGRFPFVLRAAEENGLRTLRRVDVNG